MSKSNTNRKKLVVLTTAMLMVIALATTLSVGSNIKPSGDPSDPSFATCRPAAVCHDADDYPVLADLLKTPQGKDQLADLLKNPGGNDTMLASAPRPDNYTFSLE